MSRIRFLTGLGFMLAAMSFANPANGQEAPKPRYAGPTENGFLLPNGWTLAPAGEHVQITDLPLNIIPLADGKHALASSNGYNNHQLYVIDLAEKKIVDKATVRQSWYGLATNAKQDAIWWSGGGAGTLHRYSLADLKLKKLSEIEKDPLGINGSQSKTKSFKSGLAFDAKRNLLYSLNINLGTISAIDPDTGKVLRTATLGGRPYDVAVGPHGTLLYVSDWAGKVVRAVQPDDLRSIAKISVGEHPNQIAVHPGEKDERIFVACASSNCVSVIDARRGHVTETIFTSLFPNAPEGSTPDAVAISRDGKTLFVANADNNCVAVVDISVRNKSQVKGFIPTGWYPTALATSLDGKSLLVGVGKGNQTHPNPFFDPNQKDAAKQVAAKPEKRQSAKRLYPYIGSTLSGALTIVAIPDEKKLAEYTATVYRNCPYSDKLLTDAPYPRKTAIPTKVGEPSPIKHVIYIIKENRTYDQVFGDIPEGNGDPSLTMFGEEVTPNHHKLARDFVLLDNLYCNGQVSRDGHPWSTMAYNTDFIARDWMLTYSRRVGVDDDDEGNLQKAPSGYLWDACARAGLSYRNYGEYGRRVSQPDGTMKMDAAVPGLIGHMCPDYGFPKIKGARARDTDNVEIFLKEFKKFEEAGTLPRMMILSMGEDHTSGTSVGAFTPQACVASNDLALGQLVEAVSKSKSWPETAIFVIEDDAQNGPDHVDAHRTVGLVISPYTKRKFVDSTQYSTVSMIRTMELILGLPPLSQFDAAARPMFESFTDQADLTPYQSVPNRIDVNVKNTPLAYGAERSNKMDFSDYDLADDFELNEILWRSIKGKDAPMPPAVRRAVALRLAVRNP